MDNATLANWCAALRSGDYKQSKHYLKSRNGFCCLGVALDLKGPTQWRTASAESAETAVGAQHWSTHAPGAVGARLAAELGIGHAVAQVLANHNDAGRSFEEIADWLEQAGAPLLSRAWSQKEADAERIGSDVPVGLF